MIFKFGFESHENTGWLTVIFVHLIVSNMHYRVDRSKQISFTLVDVVSFEERERKERKRKEKFLRVDIFDTFQSRGQLKATEILLIQFCTMKQFQSTVKFNFF